MKFTPRSWKHHARVSSWDDAKFIWEAITRERKEQAALVAKRLLGNLNTPDSWRTEVRAVFPGATVVERSKNWIVYSYTPGPNLFLGAGESLDAAWEDARKHPDVVRQYGY